MEKREIVVLYHVGDTVRITEGPLASFTGTVEEMAEEIRTKNDKYFLHDVPDVHSFGILDLYGDLDRSIS